MKASSTTLARQLEEIAGEANVFATANECAKYAVDALAPVAAAKPGSAEEAAEIVRFAAAEKLALMPCGARTKLGIGMPPSRYEVALDMTRLDQVAHYDAADLTLSVDAGMPLKKLQQRLAEKRQFLPLSVPFLETCTAGGAIASGVDSLLRPGYGTARDFLIGAEFIDGTGAQHKSGGRVVKNVTGYDLHKLLIGSLGTLGVITRLNFRTFPIPEVRRGFLAALDHEDAALGFRKKIEASPLTPATLEIISPEATRVLFGGKSPVASLLTGENTWHVCAGFEGTEDVCARYARELPRMAQECSARDALVLREAQYAALAERLRESLPLLAKSSANSVICRFSGLPAETATLLRAVRSFASSTWIPSAQIVRGNSEVYLALMPTGEEESFFKQAAYFWKSVESLRGKIEFHARILQCPAEWKKSLNVWGAQPADIALMQRVKKSFDPQNILAPGRFTGGI